MNEQNACPVFATKDENGWYLALVVQPGAKKSEITGIVEQRLRVRLSAPAVENKANKALLAFIAKKLGLRLSKVRLISGETSRQKRIFVECDQEPNWQIFE